VGAEPADPPPHEPEGSMMLYSSGTTGRPKGVKRPLSGKPVGSTNPLAPFLPHVGLDSSTVYLSTAPLYHGAPLGWSLATQRLGGTVVVMERFDAVEALRLIEEHRVTLAQFVPTMFSRLLDLPEAERTRHDLSSLRKVIHAGAPCPLSVKRRMIEWLGPIVDEYYSGTEGSGITYITSPEWLAHPGSVGRPILGHVHIVDDQGAVAPAGTPGAVYFSSGGTYQYHDDPEATALRQDERGWTTLDDMGWLDDDGYLHLIDRRAHMIVSGGVNISPTEVENVLLDHPAVADVAVIGVPNEEFGEEVKAVVVPAAPGDGAELPDELVSWCRQRLAGYKCPRSVDVVDELPRSDTGKLLKRVLREQYWKGHQTRIV
jgi:acyl-CoA synthetase (AMP-forming)/AMP-acid ligase II